MVPLFFYFPFSYHGLPSGKPFPPTTPLPYQIIGNNAWRVHRHKKGICWYDLRYE